MLPTETLPKSNAVGLAPNTTEEDESAVEVVELPFAELNLGDELTPIVGRPEWLTPVALPFVERLDAFDVIPASVRFHRAR